MISLAETDAEGMTERVCFVLGKFVEGRLAGVIGFRRFPQDHLKHKASLWGMYVDSRCRNRGVGSALVQACLAKAGKVKGLETIQLAVGKENRLARKLYAKFGFRKYAEERRGLKGPGPE